MKSRRRSRPRPRPRKRKKNYIKNEKNIDGDVAMKEKTVFFQNFYSNNRKRKRQDDDDNDNNDEYCIGRNDQPIDEIVNNISSKMRIKLSSSSSTSTRSTLITDIEMAFNYVKNSNYKKFRHLLDQQQNEDFQINIQEKETERTLLWYACSQPNSEKSDVKKTIIRLLIAREAKINLQDNNGQSPLIRAVISKFYWAISFLIKNGGDRFLKDNNGQRSIDYINKDHLFDFQVAKKLKESPMTIFEAILNLNCQRIKILFQESNISANQRDNTGRTLMKILKEDLYNKRYNVAEIVELLLQYGSKEYNIDRMTS